MKFSILFKNRKKLNNLEKEYFDLYFCIVIIFIFSIAILFSFWFQTTGIVTLVGLSIIGINTIAIFDRLKGIKFLRKIYKEKENEILQRDDK